MFFMQGEKMRAALIQSLTRVFKTDIGYVARSGLWSSLGQGMAILLAFLLSIIFANFVPREVYGTYKYILSVASLLAIFSLSGMGTVVVQAVARGNEGFFHNAFTFTMRAGGILFIAGLLTSGYYFYSGNTILAGGLLVVACCVPWMTAYGLYGSYLQGKKDFKSAAILWSLSQMINTALLVAAIFISGTVFALVVTYFVSALCTTAAAYYITVRRFPPNVRTESGMLAYGTHISVMNLFSTVANQLDKILVFHYTNAISLAIYSFAFAIPEQIKGSYKNLFSIALPKYASLEGRALKASVTLKMWQLTALTGAIVLVYIFAAPFIFQLFFPLYLDSVFYSQIYMIGLLAIPVIALSGTYFQVRKQTRTLYLISLTSNVVTIVLTFVLVSQYGILGAVLENGLSWFMMLLVNLYFFIQDSAV